jgi:hypothetical protein
MTLLLLGLVAALAAWRLTRHRTTRNGVLWVAPLALLVTLQLLSSGDLLTGYQIRVLAQRFALSGEESGRVISGDREGSDVYVEGAGTTPVARLARAGDTLRLDAGDGSGSIVLARTRHGPGPDWTVLRSVPLREGARIRLAQGDASFLWTFQRTPSVLGLRGSVDRLTGDGGGTVAIPYPEGAGFLGLFPGHPSVFQRTYPLADRLASFQAPGTAA